MKTIFIFLSCLISQALAEIDCDEDADCNSVHKKCTNGDCVCIEGYYIVDKKCFPVGPDVYNTKRSTGSLRIFWNPLSDDEIETYRVCYDKTEASARQCQKNKVASYNTNKVNLKDLDASTYYYIGIQVSYDGSFYGKLGRIAKEKSYCTKHAGCAEHQICLQGYCECTDGFVKEGETCKAITCDDNPCGNVGECVKDGSDWKCICPKDTFGDGFRCYDTPCYSSPCENGGTCIKNNEKRSNNQFKCLCPPGFAGLRCEENEGTGYPCDKNVFNIPYCDQGTDDGKDCDDQPCGVKGTCIPIPLGNYKYRCNCKSGFAGRTCEIDVEERCNGHGSCTKQIRPPAVGKNPQCLELTCHCVSPPYSGNHCEDSNLSCDKNNLCGTHGTCVHPPDTGKDYCECHDGYGGPLCDKDAPYQSYINFPRLHFAGLFQTDPSTVNNYVQNFNPSNFSVNNPRGWNSKGSATWRLLDTNVTRVCHTDKACITWSAIDPIVNAAVEDANDKSHGKLVDLDVQYQTASEVYGWSIKVDEFFKGDFQRVGFRYMWSKMQSGGYGAIYQSILTNVQFGWKARTSKFCQDVQEQFERTGKRQLSIRFNIDMYNSHDASGNFTYARMVGSIGILGFDAPPYFTHGRLLKPVADDSKFWFAPFVYDNIGHDFFLDWGNSMSIDEDGNFDEEGIGNLAVGLLSNDDRTAEPTCDDVSHWLQLKDKFAINLDNYFLTSGIFHSLVTVNSERTLLLNSRVILAQMNTNGGCAKVVLAEDKHGISLNPVSRWTIRAVPNEPTKVTLSMTVFGKTPLRTDTYKVKVVPFVSILSEGTDDNKNPLPSSQDLVEVTNGLATVEMNLPLIHPRPYNVGQVYAYQYFIYGKETEETDGLKAFNSAIVVVVYDDFTIPPQPNWLRHIQPIFKVYANLYPVMKNNFLDLSDFFEVVQYKKALIRSMSVGSEDPNYMPVTRDLSPNKISMIVKWLNNDHPRFGYSNLGINIDSLKHLLQTALQLEHATIPPYLTGYLTLKKGYNHDVRKMLRKILISEMHHMAQVSNLLNAIGGNPNILAPNFVLSYPSYLPGGVHPNSKITVNKFSISQVRNVYMTIEQPSKELRESGLSQTIDKIIRETVSTTSRGTVMTRQSRTNQCSAEGDCNAACDDILPLYNNFVNKDKDLLTHHNTIGELYALILIVIAKLECEGHLNFDSHKPQLEIKGEERLEVIKVTDFETATQAIKNIVEEGEGSSPCNPLDDSSDLSHFYKFSSMAKKRHLKTIKKNGHETDVLQEEDYEQCDSERPETFAYTGRSIAVDEDGVWPTVDDPMASMYKKGTKAFFQAQYFSSTYWKLLTTLQKVFDGDIALFNGSFGIMKELLMSGYKLVKLPIDENGDPDVGPNAAPVYPTEPPRP